MRYRRITKVYEDTGGIGKNKEDRIQEIYIDKESKI